jgi:hypothetical protein
MQKGYKAMAKKDESEKPKYVRDREGKRLCYVENNFPDHKPLGRILQWLDRSFDLTRPKDDEIATVRAINEAINNASKLAKQLATGRNYDEN